MREFAGALFVLPHSNRITVYFVRRTRSSHETVQEHRTLMSGSAETTITLPRTKRYAPAVGVGLCLAPCTL